MRRAHSRFSGMLVLNWIIITSWTVSPRIAFLRCYVISWRWKPIDGTDTLLLVVAALRFQTMIVNIDWNAGFVVHRPEETFPFRVVLYN